MTTLEIILTIWAVLSVIVILCLLFNDGAHKNDLEDELYPERECRDYIKKKGGLN